VDPLRGKYPHNSAFAFSENRVVDGVELEGLENVYYLGAFSSGGSSTLPGVVNQTSEMKMAMEQYRSDRNVGYNAIMIEGVTPFGNRSANGITTPVSLPAITAFLESGNNPEVGIGKHLSAAQVDLNNPGLTQALQETVDMGNELSLVVINRGNVMKAESAGQEGILNRGPAALTIVHEFVLHALDHALDNNRGQNAAHGEFYAPRNSAGEVLPDSEGYFSFSSSDYFDLPLNSRAWHVRQELETLINE
jgi:hypothetical protein